MTVYVTKKHKQPAGEKAETGTLQPLLKRLRRHGVKCASFCAGKLISVEFFPYESYYVDNDGTKLKGKKAGAQANAQPAAPQSDASASDALRSTVLGVGNLPDIRMDPTELLKPPSDKD